MSEPLQGPLHFSTVTPWFGRVSELAAMGSIDLAAVTHCDSAGVALLIELQRSARSSGRSLSFTNMPKQLRELAEFFGVAAMLGIAA